MSKKKHKKASKSQSWNRPEYNNQEEKFNTHHRLPKSRGGKNTPENLSVVPIRLHHAYNELFGSNPTADEVAQILNNTWIDPRYVLVVVEKTL